MPSPRLNLARFVILAGGVLVFLALASQMFTNSDRPWFWIGVLAGAVLAFPALLLTGQALGGWMAKRQGGDVEEGRRLGLQSALLLIGALIALERWLNGR